MPPLRILFVTPYVPSRLRTRPYGFIRALAARGHQISVFAAGSSPVDAEDAEALRAAGVSVELVRVGLSRSLWNCARGLAGDLPLQASFTHSPALTAALRRTLAEHRFDLVHVEHLRASRLGLEVTAVPCVFDAVDCISALFETAAAGAASTASRLLARLDLERTRRYEGRLLRRFDAALVTSEADRAALLRLAGAVAQADGEGGTPDLRVIPNGVDLEYFSPGEQTRSDDDIVFVGRLGYHANVAGALLLMRQVLPLVWRERPATRLTLVGAEPSAAVRAAADRDRRLRLTGRVADVRPYLATAAVAACVVPYAVGIQNKVLEAMACATPVLATSAACAALAATDGTELVRADGAGEVAQALLRLLADEALRARLGAAGRAYVEARHDWNSVVVALEELYQDVVARSAARVAATEIGARGE